jgi:hypothetical protein
MGRGFSFLRQRWSWKTIKPARSTSATAVNSMEASQAFPEEVGVSRLAWGEGPELPRCGDRPVSGSDKRKAGSDAGNV